MRHTQAYTRQSVTGPDVADPLPTMQTWKCAKPGSADWRHITMLICRHKLSPSDKDEYRLYIVYCSNNIYYSKNIVTTLYFSKH